MSVIVPMFNSARTVEESIRSLQRQTLSDFECIVVNDGSTDAGPQVVEKLALRDERIRLVHQENTGLAGARNSGLAHARGHYLAFLDADDWLYPQMLSELIKAAEPSECGAAFGAYDWRDDAGAELNWTAHVSCPYAGLDQFLGHNRFPVHGQILAAESLGNLRFREHLPVVEDYDLWLRLADQGVRWKATSQTVCSYRIRPASLSKNPGRMFDTTKLVLSESFERARRHADDHAGIDLSLERERAVILRLALQHATTAALIDPTPHCDHAASILQSATKYSIQIDPSDAAVAAYWCMPFAKCLPPTAWLGDHVELCQALDRFWRRCIRDRCADPSVIEVGRAKLACLMVQPRDVAAAMVDQINSRQQIVLLGYGSNGRTLAEALRDKGLHASVRDHAFPQKGPDLASHLTLERIDAPYPRESLYLMTPEDDRGFLARIPSGLRLIRWCEMRDRLSGDMLDRLMEAWPRASSAASAYA